MVSAGNARLRRLRPAQHRRRSCSRCATSCSSIANQSDGAGNYLFGGQGSTQKPFIDAPGGVQYRGDRPDA